MSKVQNKRRAGRPAEPVGDRLYQSIKNLIVTHAFEDTRGFPTENELCEKFSVSRGTVRTALAKIEKEGLLIRKAGNGSHLAPKGLNGFREMHDAAGDLSHMSIMEDGKLSLKIGSFEYPDANRELWKGLFGEYCKTHPEIAIKPEKTDSTLTASFESISKMPDVFNINSQDIGIIASKGLLMDLSAFEEELCGPGIVQGALDECRVDGKLYAVPQELSLGVMYCNTRLLEKLKMEIDDAAWSWEDAIDIMRSCTATHGGDTYGMNFPAACTFMIYFGIFRCDRPFISEEYSRNSGNVIKMLEWFRSALSMDNILFPADNGFENSLKKFLSGEMLFYFHGSNLNSHLQKFCHFPLKILQPPLGNKAKAQKIMVTWAVNSGTSLPLRSIEWLKFVSGEKGMRAIATKSGNVPARIPKGTQCIFPPGPLESQLSSGAFHRLPIPLERILEIEAWRPALNLFFKGEKTISETLETLRMNHRKIESICKDRQLIFGLNFNH